MQQKKYRQLTPDELCEKMNLALEGKFSPWEEAKARIWKARREQQSKEKVFSKKKEDDNTTEEN